MEKGINTAQRCFVFDSLSECKMHQAKKGGNINVIIPQEGTTEHLEHGLDINIEGLEDGNQPNTIVNDWKIKKFIMYLV